MDSNVDVEGFRNDLLDLINKYASQMVNHEGALCTNYILSTEFVDVENTFWTLVVKDETVPPWRTCGLLQYVIETEYTEGNEEE